MGRLSVVAAWIGGLVVWALALGTLAALSDPVPVAELPTRVQVSSFDAPMTNPDAGLIEAGILEPSADHGMRSDEARSMADRNVTIPMF